MYDNVTFAQEKAHSPPTFPTAMTVRSHGLLVPWSDQLKLAYFRPKCNRQFECFSLQVYYSMRDSIC